MTTFARRGFLAGARAAPLPCPDQPGLCASGKTRLGVGLANEPVPSCAHAAGQAAGDSRAGTGARRGSTRNICISRCSLRMLQGIAAGQLQSGTLGSTPSIRAHQRRSRRPDRDRRWLQHLPASGAGGLPDPQSRRSQGQDGADHPRLRPPSGAGTSHPGAIWSRRSRRTSASPCATSTHWPNSAVRRRARRMSSASNRWRWSRNGRRPRHGAAQRRRHRTRVRRSGRQRRGHNHRVFAKTPFAPESYYPHRIWRVGRRDFLPQQPKVVTPLLVANRARGFADQSGDRRDHQGGLRQLARHARRAARLDRRRAVEAARLVLGDRGRRQYARRAVDDQGDLPERLDPDVAKKLFVLGADVSKAAYDATGRVPDRAAFDDMRGDVRGKPIWEAASWNLKA